MNAKPALSILIVEDDKMTSKMIGIVIAHKIPGVIINTANNGKQGMDLFKMHMPDLVITDINMSEMDGIKMVSEIKSIKGNTYIMVITGSSNQMHMDQFSEIGVIDYIVKPIDFQKLFASIENCINVKTLLLNQVSNTNSV